MSFDNEIEAKGDEEELLDLFEHVGDLKQQPDKKNKRFKELSQSILANSAVVVDLLEITRMLVSLTQRKLDHHVGHHVA